ncbi:MAG: hypothetical protein HRU15_20635 [Planctomycetes bacterium]|nr:hypothetical protein [Planctomycetota bacterium]
MTPNSKKPGIRSTEFWLSTGATVLGIILASGAIPDGGMAAQIIGGIVSVLASLGYTASRTQVKVAAEITQSDKEHA